MTQQCQRCNTALGLYSTYCAALRVYTYTCADCMTPAEREAFGVTE